MEMHFPLRLMAGYKINLLKLRIYMWKQIFQQKSLLDLTMTAPQKLYRKNRQILQRRFCSSQPDMEMDIVNYFSTILWGDLPDTISSKLDLASGCLSNDLGVKTISCKTEIFPTLRSCFISITHATFVTLCTQKPQTKYEINYVIWIANSKLFFPVLKAIKVSKLFRRLR